MYMLSAIRCNPLSGGGGGQLSIKNRLTETGGPSFTKNRKIRGPGAYMAGNWILGAK